MLYFSLSSADFSNIARSISEVFDTETAATYFVAAQAKKPNSQLANQPYSGNRNASGKLVTQFSFYRAMMFEANLRERVRARGGAGVGPPINYHVEEEGIEL